MIDSNIETSGAVTVSESKSTSPLIICENLVKIYKVADLEVVALQGMDLLIDRGELMAVVGPSGAGKSTILNLIPRFYDTDEGRVTVDGTDVRDLALASLRAQIALVSQDVTLFDDSIAANIGFGRPEASREDIIAAAKAAEV